MNLLYALVGITGLLFFLRNSIDGIRAMMAPGLQYAQRSRIAWRASFRGIAIGVITIAACLAVALVEIHVRR